MTESLRGRVVRRVRRLPLGSAAIDAARAARRDARLSREEQVILRSEVFDVGWYEAQCGESFASPRQAVRHYLRSPRRLGYSPNPFFEAEALGDAATTKAADPLVAYLEDSKRRSSVSPHPYLDLERLRKQVKRNGWRTAESDDLGPWQAWARNAGPSTKVPAVDGLPPATVETLRAELFRAAQEWKALADLTVPHRRLKTLDHPVAEHSPNTMRATVPGRPQVSVVIATWNRSHSVRTAIDSARAQTLADIEVIVVDDGSDDDTAAVVAGIAHFDDRVRYLARGRGGVCRARNAGLEIARGEYVAFLDSDNTWRPEFLATMVAAMDRHDWDLAHGALEMRRGARVDYRAGEGSHESLLLGNYIDLNVLLVRQELLNRIGGFDEGLRRAVDYDLVLRLTRHARPHLVEVVGADYSDDAGDVTRISNSEPFTWNDVVQNRHLVDWEKVEEQVRTPGRVSVVVPVAVNLRAMSSWIDLLRTDEAGGEHSDLDLELIVVGMVTRSQLCVLTALAHGLPVTLIPRNPGGRLPVLSNLGIAASTGEYVVLCRPNATVRRRDLRPLLHALDDPGVAIAHPLVERTDMTTASAGAVFGPGSLQPHPLLAGFPVNDALPLDGADLPGALSPVLAMRAADLIGLRGLEPLVGNALAETDLSLRARESGLGGTRLVTDSRPTARSQNRYGFPVDMAESTRVMTQRWRRVPDGSTELWARAGFDHVAYRPVELSGTEHRSEKTWGLRPEPSRRNPVVVRETVPALRWTIDISAPAGVRGEHWGDRAFAGSLARALERRGQQVAVDHREARGRSTRVHDDVLLVIRGLDEVFPAPGPVNLLWVISHPELVTPWEAARYDAVLAASTHWSAQAGERWGISIKPLLQCTDPELFNPERGRPDSGPKLLFVGNSRKVFRPIVQHALATGAELTIYGRDWEQFIDAHLVAGLYVPNHEVGTLYASAGLVLNDHWTEMGRAGFMSNRLFDAVACGARVASDDVPGITETFGDSVAVVGSAAELERIVHAPPARCFPDEQTRLQRAQQVHVEHSFDARAEQLIDRAVAVLRARQDTGLVRGDHAAAVRRW